MKQDNECDEFGIVNCHSKKTISKTEKPVFVGGGQTLKRLTSEQLWFLRYAKDFTLSCLEVTDSLEIVSATLCTNMSWHGFIKAVKTIINF